MRLKTILFIGLLCFFQSKMVYGQGKNYFSFEMGGSGGLGSLNYEYPIFPTSNLALNLRFGFSVTPIDKNNGVNMIFPVMVHWLVGKSDHKMDFGIGQALSFTTKARMFISTPLAAGYRYEPAAKNYFFRVAYTPLVSYLVNFQWQNWAGITYGYHFNRKK